MVNEKRGTYKIGLISTHGTGKTTLAYEVASLFKKKGFKVRVITEVAGEAFEEGIPINENTNLSAQMHILLRHMAEEMKAMARKYEIIICDRSVFDNWIYLERKCGYHQFILDLIREYAKKFPYDALYKLPILRKEMTDDGIRDSSNKDFQEDIFERLSEFLDYMQIKHSKLPDPQTELRNEWAEIIVNDALKKMKKWQTKLRL
ncbi:ATP-binding protein [Nanoarchaeota archaeon]